MLAGENCGMIHSDTCMSEEVGPHDIKGAQRHDVLSEDISGITEDGAIIGACDTPTWVVDPYLPGRVAIG